MGRKRGKYLMKRVIILQHSGNLMGMLPELTKQDNPKFYNYFLECGHNLLLKPHSRMRMIEYHLHRAGLKIFKNCPECQQLVRKVA